MQTTGLIRSTAFRTAISSGILFVMMAIFLMALVYATATSTIEQQVLATVEAQARAIEQTLDAQAEERERPRWPVAAADETYRFIVDRNGQILTSEIVPKARPIGPLILSASRTSKLFPGNEDLNDSGLVGFGIRGAEGGYVFVAQEDEHLSELREALLGTLAVAAGLAMAMSLGWGLFIAWRSFRRIDQMNAAAASVMAGDMTKRMPLGPRGDEIDTLARQLNKMLDQLERVMEAIRQVSADIAHDLRTPLSRLQRRLERIALDPTPAERSELVEQALAETATMLEIFSSLLRISQIEGGGAQQQFAPVDLSSMIHDLHEIYQPVFADGGRSLSSTVDDGITTQGDRALLQQMFVNLLENIITHTPPRTNAHIHLQRNGPTAWNVTIQDDGPGIAGDHQARVFRRFYRIDPSRSTGGSGLGLALVKAIADAHELIVSIEPSGGLRVRIAATD